MYQERLQGPLKLPFLGKKYKITGPGFEHPTSWLPGQCLRPLGQAVNLIERLNNFNIYRVVFPPTFLSI